MTNKEALAVITYIIDIYNGSTNYREPVNIAITNDIAVGLYKAEYVLRKLTYMEQNLAEEYVDLLDVDYPPRDDFWDGYKKGYHDCEVELQAKQAEGEKKDEG